MVDFKGLEGLYDDINQVGSRPVGLMTEFKTESGRPIYISHSGEIVTEKSMTIPYNGKYVNVPSIHDGIEYSKSELIKLLDEKQIKPTSTHKTEDLAVKAAQKRSPSLMSEETSRAVESKYWKEMTQRKATADQILGDSSTELVTPDAKANIQMRDLELINEDDFLGLVDPSEKTDKLDAYMSTLSEQDKLNIQKTLKKPKARINSIEGDESMAKGRARRNLEDQTVSAFAEGGMEDGGLKDEGGTVDPVSGNDVPSGSTQAEVRDDIPAQLSEGEFVFPADVVRYIGLENLMELRSKAKQGLAKMEAMGQMGNADEATMDDSGEYDGEIDELIDNFDPNDPETMSFAEGGVVHAQQGTFVPGIPQQQFSYGYMPPQQQVGYQPPQVPATQFPDYSQFVSRPAQSAVGEQRGITEQRQYIGPNGEMITILFMDGKPQQEIPAGYKVYKPEEVKPEVVAPTVTPKTDGGGDGPQDTSRDMSGFDISIANDTLGMIGPDDPGFAGLNAATQAAQAAKTKAELLGLVAFVAPFGIGAAAAEKAKKDYDIAEKKMREELGKVQQTNPTYRAKMIEKAIEQMQEDFGISEEAATNIANEMDAVSRGEDFNIEDDAIPEEDTITVDPVTGKISIGGKSLADYNKGRGDGDAPSAPSGPPGGSNASDDPSEQGSTGGGGGGDRNDPSDPGGGFGPSFSKGGLAEQTQRALKSSRKK